MTFAVQTRQPGSILRAVPLGIAAAALIFALGAGASGAAEPPGAPALAPAPAPEPSLAVGDRSPLALVERLAALGPRTPSRPAHAEARALLLDHLRQLGLEEVGALEMPNGTRNIQGVLSGADPAAGEIVLAAHYDTVEESSGAADDAAGCAVVLAAVAELRRTPLRRTVRVLFFDGEEAGLLGSEAWAAELTPSQRDLILGAIHLDLVGLDREGAPVLLDLVGATLPPAPGRAPAWLVHAALRAGTAVGFRFRVGDHRFPLLAQILTRTAGVPWSSDAAALLDAGIPAVVLTDFSALHPDGAMHTPDDLPGRLSAQRLDRWVTVTAAVVRRLDALQGRPLWEEEYLAFAGRVFIRRDLTWIGLGLWIALVLRGRPGRWAGAQTDERKARGRSYLPGYLFRLAFLIAAIWMPSLAAPFLYPLAPLGMLAPRTTAGRAVVAAAAFLPTALGLGLVAGAAVFGLVLGFAIPAGRALLLMAVLAAFGWQLWSSRDPWSRGDVVAPAAPGGASGGGSTGT